MKKKLIMIIALLLLLGAALQPSQTVLASTKTVETKTVEMEGKLTNGRLLVPVRAVAEHFGAKVMWNAKEKSVTISDKGQEIVLVIDSVEVGVNTILHTIDVPAKVYNNITYVPISFVTSILGGKVAWDNTNKQATVTYNGTTLLIQGKVDTKVVVPKPPTSQRILQLFDKLDEAVDLSKFAQIRQHFQPYFTDTFINELIVKKGLDFNYVFTERNTVIVNTGNPYQALLTQSSESDKNNEYYPDFLYRNVLLVFKDGLWKVETVRTQIVEPRP